MRGVHRRAPVTLREEGSDPSWMKRGAGRWCGGLAVRVARGYAACDGGGRWRVYGTRVAAVGDGPVEVVLGRRLAEGLETHRQG